MEDAIGCPAGKQESFPAALAKAESRYLIVEVEVQHLRLVDGHIGFLALGWEGRILNRHRHGKSSGAGDGSQILRPRIANAARQSIAEPLLERDLKRVVPPIAVVLVIITNAAELRKRP